MKTCSKLSIKALRKAIDKVQTTKQIFQQNNIRFVVFAFRLIFLSNYGQTSALQVAYVFEIFKGENCLTNA